VYAFVVYRTVSTRAGDESDAVSIFDVDCSATDGEVAVDDEVEVVVVGHVVVATATVD
jgi:hypothetical protein